MSASESQWVGWVAGARTNDAGQREQLDSYFNPFVHAVAVAHVAHHLAGPLVRHALAAAQKNLHSLSRDAEYGRWLLDLARRMSIEAARAPLSTVEQPGSPDLAAGRRVLARLRTMPESTRERLAMRLLEGINGPEMSEVLGVGETDLRNELERGLTQLCQLVDGEPVSAAGDGYLWSLIGTPHPAVVPLENQLTPLRYDPTAEPSDALGTSGQLSPEVTPLTGAPLKATEGRRPTPPAPSPQLSEEDYTSPVGVKLTDDPTSSSGVGLALREDDGGFKDEKTVPITDLPAAAQQNPFEVQPSTIQASDLPAAAQVVHTPGPLPAMAQGPVPAAPHGRRPTGNPPVPRPSASAGVPWESQPRSQTNTRAAPLTNVAPPAAAPAQAQAKKPVETDNTAPRGVPLSVLAREHLEPETNPRQAENDWRTNPSDYHRPSMEVQRLQMSSGALTRGWYPFAIAGFLTVVSLTVAWVNLRSSERAVRSAWRMLPVAAAATNIAEGTTVTEDLIAQRMVPEQFVTSSVVKPETASYIVNQRIMVAVQAGDPLMWSQFEQARANERLAAKVHKKSRAMSLDVGGTIAVGGWVKPGDSVDIVVTMVDPALKNEKLSLTLLQAVPIIATGKITTSTNTAMVKPTDAQYRHVSVLVLPEEAEMLSLMRAVGTFKLTMHGDLRDGEAPDVMEERGRSTIHTLISGERARAIQEKRHREIEMIRGSHGGDAIPDARPNTAPLPNYPK